MRRSSKFSEVVMPEPLQIGLLIFPKVTQLDLTGPVQVFSSVPGAKVHLIWKRIEPVTSDSVLTLTPTITFADCPQLDVICVPGGFGTDEMVNDEEVLDFLRKQAKAAKYITSVCTGSLVLGVAAGIDFALTLVSIMVDRQTAEAIQLRLEYNPAPPFNAGSPDTAPPEILALLKERNAPAQARRGEAVRRA